MSVDSFLGVAILAAIGLAAILANRHRFATLLGAQLLLLAAVQALAMAHQRVLAIVALVFGLVSSLLALRLAQHSAAADGDAEPPP